MRIEHERHLTPGECDDLAVSTAPRRCRITDELEKETLLELAQCYRDLAQMKRLVLHKVN